jgi:Flp pilus assembly protein TadG
MKKFRSKKFWSNVAGTAAIEFAILSVPFAGVTTGVFEAARACWTFEALQDSAIQGARCIGVKAGSCYLSGAFNATSAVAHIQSVAKTWGVSIPDSAVTVTQDTSCGNIPGFSEVRISYGFSSVVGNLVPSLNNVPLSASSCFPNRS